MRSIRLEVRGDGQEGLRSTQGRNPAEPRQMAQQSRRVYTQGSRPGWGHGLRGAIKNIGLGPSPGLLNQSLWGTSVFNMPPAWFQCAQTSREAAAVPAPPWEFHGPGFESSWLSGNRGRIAEGNRGSVWTCRHSVGFLSGGYPCY